VRIAGFAFVPVCWFTAMIQFHVQSWNPQPTPVGATIGWLLVLSGTVLAFLCTFGISPSRIPGSLAYLGRISYGLYVVHSFIFFLLFEKLGPLLARHFPPIPIPPVWRGNLGAALVLGLSIAAAHLSYRYFERPFLRLKEGSLS
jgi:peptidoglycan/LPS O-acetylase OafA/YrhL